MIINALLFDLDGTLVDTAPDLVESVQLLLQRHGRERLDYADIRPSVPHGALALVKAGFADLDCPRTLDSLRLELFDIYDRQLLNQPVMFDGLNQQIEQWENTHRPWGIVTNKPTRFASVMLRHLGLDTRISVLVCGDTLDTRKPDPAPLEHAARQLALPAQQCLYIGDDYRDALACRRAHMPCLVAAYDFIPEAQDPATWNADGVIRATSELMAGVNALMTAA